jgi:hypothetical protein
MFWGIYGRVTFEGVPGLVMLVMVDENSQQTWWGLSTCMVVEENEVQSFVSLYYRLV